MGINLTPIAAAMALLLASQAYANGGAAGDNGQGSVIGKTDDGANDHRGSPGMSGTNANGGDGASYTAPTTINTISSDTPSSGLAGDPPANAQGGGGAGGHGGGSVIGATSTGGAGGYTTSSSANGGNGGNVGKKTILLDRKNLDARGATGGKGGSVTAPSSSSGGGGSAGHGGGSVFGGISTGGAGGYSTTTNFSSANGGSGGDVSGNTIEISNSTLTGAAGGEGGSITASSSSSSSSGGGGSAGHGGGSVFGGISTGGAGGYSTTTNFSSANGGSGGEVSGNKIRISNSTLTGKAGGAGGSVTSTYSSWGGGGSAGHGGGSVFGGISTGGAGGYSYFYSASASANGGNGGDVSGNTIEISNSTLTGAAGGEGGSITAALNSRGGGGSAGHGGGSVFGGISTGGAGGASASANGGNGGDVSGNTIEISHSTLTGTVGGAGGSVSGSSAVYGGGGSAGHGGGSVFGGISTGGAAGYAVTNTPGYYSTSYANGGNGGAVTGQQIEITSGAILTGAAGGAGASVAASSGGGVAAGHGGGSVFGGISTGGAGGRAQYVTPADASSSSAGGGTGGNVLNNQITLTGVKLDGSGATGGAGGSIAASSGGGGAAGHGGGSVFGGISTGGAGGYAYSSSTVKSSSSANGGNGGNILNNQITLTDVNLDGRGATGGVGGSVAASSGGGGAAGHGGGSVFGGISTGGAGGYASSYYAKFIPSFPSSSSSSANGGNGGDVTDNHITVSGVSKISGSIYGGISQGGNRGQFSTDDGAMIEDGAYGQGGLVQNNTITLIGKDITIGGSIYGGQSFNGNSNGVANQDANFSSYYKGNTLNLEGYKGSVQGIYNIEKYNWVLPKDVVNGTTMVTIQGNTAVQLDHTKHTAAMYNDGNRLSTGDKIILIDKAQGSPTFASNQTVKQGHFILYDASLAVEASKLVLTIGKDGAGAAGRSNPTAKAFLEGRASSAASTNQGADMVSDSAMAAARMSAGGDNGGMFMGSGGGSSRYHTGSHIDVRDVSFALGVSKALAWQGSSTVTLGAFVEHSQGRYDTYNNFGALGEVRGRGDSQNSGVGVLMHIAGLGLQNAIAPKFGAQAGLYLNTALRAGRAKNTFDSSDLDDGTGVRGRYSSRTSYFSAMVGGGYVLNLNEQSAVDMYGRYTWGKLGADTAMVGNSALEFGASQSSRVRLGALYSYTYSKTVTPYVGLSAEREFKGDASGSSSGLDIAQPSLKGTTGIVEVGASMKPWASQQALSLDVGLQGYFGKREGASGSVKIKYAF